MESGSSPNATGPALIAGVVVAIFGIALGFLWYLLAPTLPLRKVEGGLAYIVPDPEQPVAADGWFTILGFAFGILAAVAVWALARRTRGPIQLLGLTLGAIAAGLIAWKVGSTVGKATYEKDRAAAVIGETVQKSIDLAAAKTQLCVPFTDTCKSVPGGDTMVPALGAVVGYSLLAGWSRWPNLRPEADDPQPDDLEPDPEPGLSSGTGSDPAR